MPRIPKGDPHYGTPYVATITQLFGFLSNLAWTRVDRILTAVTPLDLAVAQGDEGIVQMLLKVTAEHR